MTKTSKENLEKLLLLLDDICALDENQWFKEALSLKYSNCIGFENFPAFLRHQKKQFRMKGRSFYSSISDKTLKKQLIDDYVEMSWYQSVNNINRFILFVFYQMENLLNHYSLSSNASEKLLKNKDYYTHLFGPNFTVIAYDGFYYNNKLKTIEKINIWAKLTFWMIDANQVEWEKNHHSNISNLINIRNANSHRSSNTNNEIVNSTINFYEKSDFSSLGFYINILKKIIDTFKSIDPTIKAHEVKIDKPIIPKPKQVGFIDPKNFRR